MTADASSTKADTPLGRPKVDPTAVVGGPLPLSFGSGDDPSPLDSFVISNLLDLALNADDDDVRRKATRDLAEGRGLFARATAREQARYDRLPAGAGRGRDLVITDERTFASLMGGLRTLGLGQQADGVPVSNPVSVEVSNG
jgi:hypothetical protein